MNQHYTKKGPGRKHNKPNIPGYSLGKEYWHVKNAKTLRKIIEKRLGL